VTEPRERPVRTIFLGSGSFATPTLDRLAAHPSVDIVSVVTAPPRPAGRRRIETPTPIGARARELGLALRTPNRLRDPAVIGDLLDLGPELVVLADYGQIVPRPLLDRRFGALNLHPSLLPRHRGATPIPAAILAGDAETGVTLIRMDDGIDSGPIVAVERTQIAADEAAPGLEARLATMAGDLLARMLDPWLDGTARAEPQAAEGATLTRPLRRDDGRLDAAAPAAVLERQIRGYLPWPGTFLEIEGQRLVVRAGGVAASVPGDEPGRLVADADGLALTTVDGRLVLAEVQPAGGRLMTGAEFVRGRPAVLGRSVTPSTPALVAEAGPAPTESPIEPA